MSKKITYKIATKEDYDSILLLYNNAYQSNRTVSNLQWLYDKNPMGKGNLFIAIVEDAVIGMQGIVKYQFWKSQIVIDSYKSEDSLIHSDYRGKGIYKKLYQMVFEFIGDTPIWGLTDKKKILERTGLPSNKQFISTALVKGFITPSIFKNEKKKWAKTLLYNSLNFANLIGENHISEPGNYFTESINDFTDLADFGRVLSKQYPDIQVPILSEDLIQWRLPNNPKVKNWKVLATKNSNHQIKAITLVTHDDKRCRWLSSYFHKDLTINNRSFHIQEVKNMIYNLGIVIIEQWLFDTNLVSLNNSNLMYSNGFRKVKKGLWIVKNQPNENATVHEILYSAQLGLD